MEQNVAKFQRPGDLMWHQTMGIYSTGVGPELDSYKDGYGWSRSNQWVITSNKLNVNNSES